MNRRLLLSLLAWLLCVGAVWGMLAQRQELIRLRVEQDQKLPRPDPVTPSSQVASQPAEASHEAARLNDAELAELLRLRAEVTRLNARKRELAGVPQEAERLRAQLATSQTNAPGANRLPPDYIRRAQAQLAGYSTPEATLESLLWALEHHDAEHYLQALSPSEAQSFSSRDGSSAEKTEAFFKGAQQLLPGLAIQGRETLPDGSVQLLITPAPGVPPERVQFELMNGEWKLKSRF